MSRIRITSDGEFTKFGESIFPRSDPAALAKFDPATKRCTMNCGQSRYDPRSSAEHKFQCEECAPVDISEAATHALFNVARQALEMERDALIINQGELLERCARTLRAVLEASKVSTRVGVPAELLLLELERYTKP